MKFLQMDVVTQIRCKIQTATQEVQGSLQRAIFGGYLPNTQVILM
jgi:hypothetical protein